MISKNELRKEAKNIRNSLNITEISDKIVANIRKNEKYKAAKHVMIFYPINNEIDLLPLLDDTKKFFYLPRIKGEELEVCPYKKNDMLILSDFKTKEPTTQKICPEILDIIFVPALMADKNLYRLGYGKGFYDKFFNNTKISAYKVIPLASLLVRDSIPTNPLDARADRIITETQE